MTWQAGRLASLRLCAEAGMVQVGVVTLDGTKLAGNAADVANRTLTKLHAEVAEILRQAADADQRDDQRHGTGAEMSCPPRWRPRPAGWPGCGRPPRLEADAAARQ